MAHIRQTIRTAIAELLSGETDAGTNVYTNREHPLWESELPAILISTRDESADQRDISGRQAIRTLNISIEAKRKATEYIDDDLDDLCEQIEDIMSANLKPGGSISCIYKGTEVTIDGTSDTLKGVATLNYELKYIR